MGSGMVLGTDALLPSTFTVKVSAAVGPAVADFGSGIRLIDSSRCAACLIERRTMPLGLKGRPQDRRQRRGEQTALPLLPLPARNERGEGRGEGKALKTLLENDPVFPRHRPPSPSGNTASRAATSRGAPDWRKRSVRFSLSSGRGLG